MKKLINSPGRVAIESLEGLVLAYPQYLRQIDGLQAVVRLDSPRGGKVAILTGGGSGHEPMFAGYVGRGMANASVAGNVFASPPPPPIYQAAKAVDGGAGILFLYGNYSGDILNFDVAAEMLQADGISVRTVRVTDDVASATSSRRQDRRGIAGDFFVIKIAGAKAEERANLPEVVAVAQKANDHLRTTGVSLSSCTIPASGRPIFELSEAEIEIGMGIHGEPGVRRGPLRSADEIASEMITRILEDLPTQHADEVARLG